MSYSIGLALNRSNQGWLRPGAIGAWLALAVLATPLALAARSDTDPELLERLRAAAREPASSFSDRFEAEVWLADMSTRLGNRISDDDERIAILKGVHAEAEKHDLPPELVLAVIEIESNFDRFAISYAGAQGLMQVMPFWLDEIGRPNDNLFHIETNLRMGCTILRHYLDKENGDLVRGLARYNGSLGRTVYSNKVLDRLRTRWRRIE
ncbi:MAG: lytic transglycosylase domain-containing protein [Pseudomonadota bacterium]